MIEKNNYIIPFWYELVLAIARDFENENITWIELYNRIFIEDTNINNLMIKSLGELNVAIDSKVKVSDIILSIKNVRCTFDIVEEKNTIFLVINQTNEKRAIISNDINKTLEKMGYFYELNN